MSNDARTWIRQLNLEQHPEGGWFKETYRSTESIPKNVLPERFTGSRAFSTAIYFLLEGNDFSALHRIRSDELWHFYTGSALTLHIIEPQGTYRRLRLGGDPHREELFQGVVAAGCWFGASTDNPDSFALVGCTVSPGFDFADFELGARNELLRRYPQHQKVIERLSRA